MRQFIEILIYSLTSVFLIDTPDMRVAMIRMQDTGRRILAFLHHQQSSVQSLRRSSNESEAIGTAYAKLTRTKMLGREGCCTGLFADRCPGAHLFVTRICEKDIISRYFSSKTTRTRLVLLELDSKSSLY